MHRKPIRLFSEGGGSGGGGAPPPTPPAPPAPPPNAPPPPAPPAPQQPPPQPPADEGGGWDDDSPEPPRDWTGGRRAWVEFHRTRTKAKALRTETETQRTTIAELQAKLAEAEAKRAAAEGALSGAREQATRGEAFAAAGIVHPSVRRVIAGEYEAYKADAGKDAKPFGEWLADDETKANPVIAPYLRQEQPGKDGGKSPANPPRQPPPNPNGGTKNPAGPPPATKSLVEWAEESMRRGGIANLSRQEKEAYCDALDEGGQNGNLYRKRFGIKEK